MDEIAKIRARNDARVTSQLLFSMYIAQAEADREFLLAVVDRLRAVLQDIAEELEGEEPRSHKKIALSIREALKT